MICRFCRHKHPSKTEYCRKCYLKMYSVIRRTKNYSKIYNQQCRRVGVKRIPYKTFKVDFTVRDLLDYMSQRRSFCVGCSRHMGKEKMTIDHIVPMSVMPKNIKYRLEDLQLMCQSCNSKKKNKV